MLLIGLGERGGHNDPEQAYMNSHEMSLLNAQTYYYLTCRRIYKSTQLMNEAQSPREQ